MKKIQSALLSVYSKDKIEPIVRKLDSLKIKMYSTGGTYDFIKGLGINATKVEDVTSFPAMLGGRVKTLHPKIFGGILFRRDMENDIKDIKKFEIPEIDLVIVDLYPFEKTVASTNKEEEIIEKIDIGGVSLIRAAAKNYKDVLIVASSSEYDSLQKILEEQQGETSIEDRKRFAANAFNVTSHYDTAIFNFFNKEKQIKVFKKSILTSYPLRYGENPHQTGMFYGDLEALFTQLNGKEVSYNNLLDIDAAVHLIDEFTEPTFAILKHNNACGIASRSKLIDAWKDALAGDPISAFGGVLITNKSIDKETAEEINSLFFEVIIAPVYEKNVLELLKGKKNRIILQRKPVDFPEKQHKSILNGVVEQLRDTKTENFSDLHLVTKATLSDDEKRDLVFANIIVKHTKSNAIVLAKNNQLLASGVGQTSRVDALKQAIEKAKQFGKELKGAVMASDAYFPFPDCVEIAHKEGINAVIQPGGSIRDKDSIAYCDENGMAMVLTGFRHFKH